MAQILKPEKAKDFLIDDLKAQGFDAIGIMAVEEAIDQTDRLTEFVANEYHGSMAWIEETLKRRSAPANLWPNAKSVIVALMRYTPNADYDPLTAIDHKSQATISCYAQNRDYHDLMKGKLKQVAGRLAAKSGAEVKIFVDTAPVMEKPLAQQAGLGWQGKHTNLVSREVGSWFFIGSIFTDMSLETNVSEIDHCGSCRACLDACPTNAFPAPYKLDARRCISYLTIEHAEPIAPQFRKAMGNRVYGCDDCLAVCPWNKFAQEASEVKLRARIDLKSPSLSSLLALDDAAFRKHFSGSPIKRIGRNRFIRNCLIAAGNSDDADLIAHIKPHIKDTDPIVRGAAIWALGELMSPEKFSAFGAPFYGGETDPYVLEEWTTASQKSAT